MSKQMELPNDIKQDCLWIVRGYRRRCNAFREARRVAMRVEVDPSVIFVEIEQLQETKRMRAVEQAEQKIGVDLPEHIRKSLRCAIMLSCENGKRYPFERLHVEGIGKTNFFKRRDMFLEDIAKYLEYI